MHDVFVACSAECFTVQDFESKFFIRAITSFICMWLGLWNLWAFILEMFMNFCSHCKNTCRRKSGRTRGFVCRDNGLLCSANCDYGPEGKPRSNRKEIYIFKCSSSCCSTSQFILWRFGKLGRGNRNVCPACTVRIVREAYPAIDGQYLGFRRS